MRIAIYTIRAKILDASTNEEDDYIIEKWTIEYMVDFLDGHTVHGQFDWLVMPDMKEILKFIREFHGNKN